MIHHAKAASHRQQPQTMARCQRASSAWHGCSGKGDQSQLFHQQQITQSSTVDTHIAGTQDIPYADETPEQCQRATVSNVDNGLNSIPQAAVSKQHSSVANFGRLDQKDILAPSGHSGIPCTGVDPTSPSTILSANTIVDESTPQCQMTHVVQPSSPPCITVKRRNIFSCCRRKRGSQKHRASMSMSNIGCCSGQHISSGKTCYNSKVNWNIIFKEIMIKAIHCSEY